MKGSIVRIDKTARQKGAPSWLKELIYVDDAKNAAKPAREGGTRSDSLLKANATHSTTCDGGPKGIATYPSNSEGNVLNEPAETGEKNFDTCNGELEIAAKSECDLVFFSLRRIAERSARTSPKRSSPSYRASSILATNSLAHRIASSTSWSTGRPSARAAYISSHPFRLAMAGGQACACL